MASDFPLGMGTLGRQGLKGHVMGRWALFPWVAVTVEVPASPLSQDMGAVQAWGLGASGMWEPVVLRLPT